MSLSPYNKHQQYSSKSPSRRGIYINEEINKKQKHTTFHSPYKDGRPNKDYINPSFISSHLFYPKEYIENKQIAVQKNIVENENDIKKEKLYRQRMRTEVDQRQRSKTKEKEGHHRVREFKNDRSSQFSKILRLNDPENLLNNELQCLQDYRQNLQYTRKERNNRQRENEIPPYFEKQRGDNTYEVIRNAHNRKQMGNWMALTQELKEIKKEIQRANQAIEGQRSSKQIQENIDRQKSQEHRLRKQTELLSGILSEQMKVNQLKREKRWNY